MSANDREKILDLIVQTLRLFTTKEFDGKAVPKLYGGDGLLESITFVSFIIRLEQKLNETFHLPIRLVSDRALSQSKSPFTTAPDLALWIDSLLTEARGT
ncbi:MAG: hypothetical protein ACXVA9_02805 [Bdellovibrionales bacterium]